MLSLAWSELSVRHGGSAVPGSTPLSAATALASSDSVLLLPEMASASECDAVVQACSQALALGQRLVRLPSIAMAAEAELDIDAFDGDPPAGAKLSQIPAEADAICDVILRRVLAVVDRELGPVVVSQFGTNSLSELLAAGELEFASREPAVNVYAEGGNFPPHEDHQALTVLVPLSEHGGGGTGFWASDDEGAHPAQDAGTVFWAQDVEEEEEGTLAAGFGGFGGFGGSTEDGSTEDDDDAEGARSSVASFRGFGGFGAAADAYAGLGGSREEAAAEWEEEEGEEDEGEAEFDDSWYEEGEAFREEEMDETEADETGWARVTGARPPTVLRARLTPTQTPTPTPTLALPPTLALTPTLTLTRCCGLSAAPPCSSRATCCTRARQSSEARACGRVRRPPRQCPSECGSSGHAWRLSEGLDTPTACSHCASGARASLQSRRSHHPIIPPPLAIRRVVFVASFSGVRFWPDPWHRPLGAATYTVMKAPAEG